MNWRLLALSMLCALVTTACVSTPAPALVTDVPSPQADTVRQRAMRRLVLASAYYEQGLNDVAQQETRTALKIDPTFPEALSMLGLIYQRDNAPEQAEKSFAQALDFASAEPTELAAVQHNYGWFLCLQNRFLEGQTQLGRALSQPGYRGVAKTWVVLGMCQQRALQTEQARHSYLQALNYEPHNTWVRVQLAELEWQRGQPQQAQRWLTPALSGPDVTAPSLWLGIRLAHAQAQSVTIQQLAEQLNHRFPDSPQAQAWREQKFDQP